MPQIFEPPIRPPRARIHRRGATPMQSGRAGAAAWVLEFAPNQAGENDPLMGWASSGDVLQQVHLDFPSRAEAEGYARRQGMVYEVTDPPAPRRRVRMYADNFTAPISPDEVSPDEVFPDEVTPDEGAPDAPPAPPSG